MDSLLNTETFGYTSSDKINVTSISSTSVEIQSPVVNDSSGFPVSDYAVLYGQYPIDEAMDNPSLLNQFGEKEVHLTDSGSNFTVTLDASTDDIDTSKTYYAIIMPKDDLDLP
ncbi:MAG: hypothetical protein GXP45_07715 [bacterium]|nr:hypothetical protein [bacterium]